VARFPEAGLAVAMDYGETRPEGTRWTGLGLISLRQRVRMEAVQMRSRVSKWVPNQS